MTATATHPTWKKFLAPGWVIAAICAIAFSWFAITWLSPWQLGKDHDLKERNARIEAAFEAAPVPLADLVGPAEYSPDQEWTRVSMTGRYVPEHEVLLRLRPVEGTPAFQALTPFELDTPVDGHSAVLINRGWVQAEAGGTRVPAFSAPPSESVTVTGMVRTPESPSADNVVQDQGYTMVQSVNTGELAELTGMDLLQPYVQLMADEPGVLAPIPIPSLDRGNHLSYGLQWIAFGIMAPAALFYFVYSEIREARRYRAEQAEMAELVHADATGDFAPPAPARARYGASRRNPWADKREERW